MRSFYPSLFFAFVLPGFGQQQGMMPEWEIRPVLKEIAAHAGRLLPVLEKLQPEAWVAKGAPDTYVAQWNSSKAQVRALAGNAEELVKKPERLDLALETFFRIQAMENMVGALGQGVRRYENAASADELAALVAENGRNREFFQKYIVELAAQREQQFEVMHHEAQRCRGVLASQPPPETSTRKKRN